MNADRESFHHGDTEARRNHGICGLQFMTLRNAIVTMALGSVVYGALICGVCTAQTQPSSTTSAARSQSGSAASKGIFKIRSMGELMTGYGIPMGFSYFVAPDGIAVFVLYLHENDRGRATRAFQEEFAKATKIVKRGEKKGKNGTVVGERAEIHTTSKLPNRSDHAVIWTDGPTFHMIASSSLQDVLDLEKVYGY